MRLAFICLLLLLAAAAPENGEPAIASDRATPMVNPGYLAVARGEKLWALPRGAKNVSLEQCDLGEGPGVLAGAYARLPRYFKDADRVMDLEQRLIYCMKMVQELDTKDVIAHRFGEPGQTSDMEDLVAFIANKSQGMTLEPPLTNPKEKEMFAIGEAMFYRRSSIDDFSCATCHGADGRRIRLQSLPNFTRPSAAVRKVMGSWPAYHVSQGETRTLQHRLWDCYRQMRMPPPEYLSEGLTALTVFLDHNGEGAVIDVPSIKR